MTILTNILFTILTIFLFWVLLTNTYNFIISLFGFSRHKKLPQAKQKAKFAIFVPAHNEEQVIKATLDHLTNIKYHKSFFDVYVLLDNCSDKTSEIVEAYKGVKSIVRNDLIKKGKPHAIANALANINNFYNKYDLLLIVDADNIVENNILESLNNQYQAENPAMIQCYLDSKNSSGNVASGMAASYFFFNRFNQLAKYKLKLNNSILGTGFAISTSYLKEIGGFNATSLVEDLETEIATMLNKKRIVWNHETRLYDEKPTSIKASVAQRKRWAQGYWSVSFKYGIKVLKQALAWKTPFSWRLRSLDSFIKLFSLGKGIQVVILGMSTLLALFVLWTLSANTTDMAILFVNTFILTAFMFVLINGLNYFILVVVAQAIDDPNYKYSFKKHVKMIFSFFILLFTFVYTQIFGILKHKNQSEWVKTEHNITEKE